MFVSEGTVNRDKQFTCTTNAPITLGMTALAFALIAGVGVHEIVRGAAFVSSVALTTAVDPVVLHFNRAATITKVVLIGDVSGSCEVAIKKDARATYTGPMGGTSIVASDPPTISGAAQASKTSFTGWTTAIAADDMLIISLSYVSAFKRLTVQIYFTE